jgi:hypothetical protein
MDALMRGIGVAVLAGFTGLGPMAAADESNPDRQKERAEEAAPDSRAQSGADAAEDATIYVAQLKRCEALARAQREACVDVVRRRPGSP